MTWSSWGPTTRPASSGCSTEPRCPPGLAYSTSAAARARCCGGSGRARRSTAPVSICTRERRRSQEYGWWPATRGRFRPSPSRSTLSARWERSATSASWPRWPARVAWCCWATATGGERPATSTSRALGATIDDLLDWQATLAIGPPHGLTLVRALPSSVEQWDRYEATWAANGERYAARASRRAGPGGVPGLDTKRPAALHGAGRPRHARIRAAACSGRTRQSVTGA